MAITQIKDMINPEIYLKYSTILTAELTPFINSGIIQRNSLLDNLLSGGGNVFNIPSFNDLSRNEERVSSDSIPAGYSSGVADPDPDNITTTDEIAVRLMRNYSWGAADIASVLAGEDIMQEIVNLSAGYWSSRLQQLAVSTIKGVLADNAANPTSGEHVKDDMTVDIKGNAFADGTTNVTAEAILDAQSTLGENVDAINTIVVHPKVLLSLKKQNLVSNIPDARGEVMLSNYLGMRVITSSSLPSKNSIFETWLLGSNVLQLGVGSAKKPLQYQEFPGAGNGGGAETLYSRVVWCLHPVGHKYIGAATAGGPTNTVIETAGSWKRAYKEREQIKIARLISREA